MTVVCLVRHGETDWNVEGRLQGREDIELNENGKLQARNCGIYLKEENWDIIITSPLKRAKQTAKIINTHVLPIQNFIERDYGEASGLTVDEREKLFPKRDYKNQEPRELLTKRVISGLDTIQRKHPNNKVILVAHGAVINAILAHLSNGKIGSGKTKLMTACISRIQYNQKQWRINEFNQVAHL